MRCFHPIIIRGPDYSGPVPCGRCFACQSNRRKQWYFRIKEEQKASCSCYLVTLTYDDEHLPDLEDYKLPKPDNTFKFETIYQYHPYRYSDVQLFFKKLRKRWTFRYFGVCEYGSKRGRPHAHIIFFFPEWIDELKFKIAVVKAWQLGSELTVDKVTDKGINYVTKYCIKYYNSLVPPSKTFCSTKPYIGYTYMSDAKLRYHYTSKTDQSRSAGYLMRVPRIYREKYFDDDLTDSCLEQYSEHYDQEPELPEDFDPTVDLTPRQIQEEQLKKRCIQIIKNKSL